jgi:hypothetical protein
MLSVVVGCVTPTMGPAPPTATFPNLAPLLPPYIRSTPVQTCRRSSDSIPPGRQRLIVAVDYCTRAELGRYCCRFWTWLCSAIRTWSIFDITCGRQTCRGQHSLEHSAFRIDLLSNTATSTAKSYRHSRTEAFPSATQHSISQPADTRSSFPPRRSSRMTVIPLP